MISDRDLVCLQRRGSPYTSHAVPREQAEAYLEGREKWPAALRRGTYDLVPVVSCQCCGEPAWPNLRCTKHQDRNPCIVEGCTRTSSAHGGRLTTEDAICGHHWRAFVPPRSKLRLTYNAHWRRAKRIGWTPETTAAYWRFWASLVRRVRRQATEGALDEAAIRKMFGWEGDEAG